MKEKVDTYEEVCPQCDSASCMRHKRLDKQSEEGAVASDSDATYAECGCCEEGETEHFVGEE